MSETAPSAEQATSTRRVPLAIWREVRRALCTLFDLFGDPQQIASRHTLRLKDHQLLSKWLNSVEALMRRMLFLEAALIANELPTPPPARGRKIAKQSGEGQASGSVLDPLPTSPLQGEESQRFDPDHPETWRVSFHVFVFSSPTHGGSGSRGTRETKGAQRAPALEEQRLDRPLSHAAHDSSPAGGGAKEAGAPKFCSAWPLAERTEALLRVFNDPLPFAKRLAARLRQTKVLVARLCAPWDEHRDLITRSLFDALVAPIERAQAVFDTT